MQFEKPARVSAGFFIAMKRKLKRIRAQILEYLDETEWQWNRAASDLLCQIDTSLDGIRGNEKGTR